MTLLEQLTDIVADYRRRGVQGVDLSPENRQLLGRVVPQARTKHPAQPMPQGQAAPAMQAIPPVYEAPLPPPVAESASAPATAPVATANFQPLPPPPPPPQVVNVSAKFDEQLPPPPVLPAHLADVSWDELVEHCGKCNCCPLADTRHNVVIEDGCRQAPLMFIGEGPGADEDEQGVPFVGKAGQLLTAIIKAMGRDRTATDPAHAVYIANIVKCRPPRNRNPLPTEANACIGYLLRQIQLVSPKVIVLLGSVPLLHLARRNGITKVRGQWLDINGIPTMPTFHPAYLLRFQQYPEDYKQLKLLVWRDMKQVMARLNQE